MSDVEKPFHPPEGSSHAAFLRYLRTKPTVDRIENLDSQRVLLVRNKLGNLMVFVTEIYIAGKADVAEILSLNDRIDAIVLLGVMNSYTGEAKDFCERHGIGLFTFNEFMGAVYYRGKKFIAYTPPEKKK
jgi:hypothetical protein